MRFEVAFQHTHFAGDDITDLDVEATVDLDDRSATIDAVRISADTRLTFRADATTRRLLEETALHHADELWRDER